MRQFYDRLSIDFMQLLESAFRFDVCIEVSDNNIYNVHSCILQQRSHYFKKILSETGIFHVKSIKLPNISTEIFDIIIKYIYGGIVTIEELEDSVIFDLLIASSELGLDEMVEYIQNHLIDNNISWLLLNFHKVYYTALQFKNLVIIQDFCDNIIINNPSNIFENVNFISLPEEALINLLKRDDLQLEEIKIWDYVIQWGKAKNPNLPADVQKWSSENFLTLKRTLNSSLPYIRYFDIPSEEVLEKLFPYQQILDTKIWLDINTKIMAPNRPILSKILPPRKKPLPCTTSNWARVTHNYEAVEDNELSLKKGDLIKDITNSFGGWRQGTCVNDSRNGHFPVNFVEFVNIEDLPSLEYDVAHQAQESIREHQTSP